jgi:ADP-ribose diphosphatase
VPSPTSRHRGASPVIQSGPASGDTEIEKYFDMSVVLLPIEQALSGIGSTITSMETVGALMAARSGLL